MIHSSPNKNFNRPIILSVTCLGVSSIVTQIVFLREFLNVFYGNELVLGLVLGNWLLLTGIGSYLGRYAERISNPVRWLLLCQIAIALLPPFQIVMVRLLKQFFMPGLIFGIGNAFLGSLLLLLPYCLVSGFLLTLFAGMISTSGDARQIGDVYVLDAVGDIVGGLTFSLILVYFFSVFQAVAFILIINLLAASWLSHREKHPRVTLSATGILISSLACFAVFDLDWITSQAMFPGQELKFQSSTPYGSIAVTAQENQITVFENGIPVGSSHNPVAAEEMVHYGLSQHPSPKKVLLLSGGLSGSHREVEKYGPDRIDYVELDPAILDLARRIWYTEGDPHLNMIARDARRFVKSVRNEYDAILVDLPDPATAQLNRFYTVEFFAEVHRALRPDGVFSFSLSGAENYANPQVRLLSSAVYRSLSTVFTNILIIPGAQQFFIASERPLDYSISHRLKNRGIETVYVNDDYLKARLTEDRVAAAQAMISADADLNRDFFPGTYFAHLQYWLSQFGSSLLLPTFLIVGVAILLGLLLAGSRERIVAAALSASGFAGMGLEVILLIAFQVSYGYVYKQVGLIITAFMIGSAVGAKWSNSRTGKAGAMMVKLDTLLSGTAFFMVPVLLGIKGVDTFLSPLIFILLTGIVGFLVGAQFPIAAKLTFHGVEKTTGSLYAVDLLGACMGALLVSTFSIPLLGLTTTCYVIGGVKLTTAIGLRTRRRAPVEVPIRPAPATGRIFSFSVVLLIFAIIGALIVAGDTSSAIYSLSFVPSYHWLLLLLLGAGIVIAMDLRPFQDATGSVSSTLRRVGEKIYQKTRVRAFRWISFFGFGLVVFYPIFRCYFRVPYLFCHVCPRLCVFGYMRPYLVPAALIMNLEKRHWCYHVCPVGTLYHCEAQTGGKPARRPRVLYWVALAVLAFTAISYFKVLWDFNNQPVATDDWYTFFFTNQFGVSAVVIVLALLFILFGYRIRRTFCETLCPVGTFSGLVLKLEKSTEKKGHLAIETPLATNQ